MGRPPPSLLLAPLFALAAASDAEQFHVTVSGSEAVVVSWASPGGASDDLVVEDESGARRTIRPASESYRFRSVFPRASQELYSSPLLLHASLAVRPEASYRYRVGGGPWRRFRAPPAPGAARLRIAVLGDLGQTNFSRRTCEGIAAAHAAQRLDVGVLLGDLAYAEGNGSRWDSFGRMFDEAGCSQIPWLVMPGNHEIEPDALTGEPFLAYRRRWKTPQIRPEEVGADFVARDWKKYDFRVRYDYGGSFYSLRLGPAQFVVLNPFTEMHAGSAQDVWLEAALANRSAAMSPFLVALTHQPWHHTGATHQPQDEVSTRSMQAAAEERLLAAKVDMLFAGHLHAYERMLPVRGVHHFLVGNGGNFNKLYNEWSESNASAYRQSSHYGWGELDITFDACSWQMRRIDDSAVIDSIVLGARRPMLQQRCDGAVVMGRPGDDGCPLGMSPLSEPACRQATAELALPAPLSVRSDDMPSGCAETRGEVYWNAHPSGRSCPTCSRLCATTCGVPAAPDGGMVTARTVIAFAVTVATALLISFLLWRRGACVGERARERTSYKHSANSADVEAEDGIGRRFDT